MAEKRDYYEVLGVSKNSSEDDLKRAFRQMAKRYHPDVNPHDKNNEDKFKEVNEAYQVLIDPEKRNLYDKFGHAGVSGSFGDSGMDFGFGGFNEVFEDIFTDFFGGGRRESGRRGADLRYDLNISFKDAAFGVEKTIEIPKNEICQACKGNGAKGGKEFKKCSKCGGAGQVRFTQGFFSISRPCDKCHGEGKIIDVPCDKCRGAGKIQQTKKISVKIPAGVETGSRLRIQREGEPGVRGGNSGDLYVFINVTEDEFFERDGTDIICDAPINFVIASLGGEIDVPTLDGKTQIKIPAGTQSGKIFKIRGKGIPSLQGYGRGDQLVRIIVETPTNLNEKQRELLKEFSKTLNDDVQPKSSGFFKQVKNIFGV